MVSLTPVWKPKVPRAIKLSEPVEFDSIDHTRTVLTDTLSKADDCVEVPLPRPECQIVILAPKDHKQYRICPEQDCENLVDYFHQTKSMIEIFALDQTIERQIERFREGVRQVEQQQKHLDMGSKGQSKSWRGSSKRSQSTPVTAEERRTDPNEPTHPWKDLGTPNVDPAFLYPVDDPPCPVARSRTMSKHEKQQYMQWICEALQIDQSKDQRVYCPDSLL